MKKIIATCFGLLFAASASLAQSSAITIQNDPKNRNTLVVVQPQVYYSLPITILISKQALATNKKISILAQDKQTLLIPNIQISGLTANTDGNYQFVVGKDLSLTPCNTTQGACQVNAIFYIKVDNTLIQTQIQTDAAKGSSGSLAGTSNGNTPVYGYPYYDAMLLSTLNVNQTSGTIQTILQYYGITKDADLQGNPFLKQQFGTLFTANAGLNGLGTPISSVLQSAGNLDVTNFADGLAKFIVARMKEELSVAFFQKFKAALETPDGKKLQIIFPSTYSALMNIDKEIYNYPQYLELLRECFQKDLAVLLPDLQQLIDTTDLFNNHPKIKTILSDAVYLARQFKNGAHPGDILNNYLTGKASATDLGNINANIYPSLEVLNLMSQSLRSKYGNNYWVTPDSVKALALNQKAINIYLGLLYQKVLQMPGNDIKFGTTSLISFFNKANNIINIYQLYLTTLADKIQTTDAYFNAVKKSTQAGSTQQPDYDSYYGLISSTSDLLKLLEKCPALAGVTGAPALIDKLNIYINGFTDLSSLYIDLYYKNYPVAISDLGKAFQETLITSLQDNAATLNVQLKAAANAAKPAIEIQIKANNNEITRYNAVLGFLNKYGNFVATVVKAQNSDDVEKAIEDIAMPVGSASVKRNSFFNVALNAYIGPYIGGERIHGFDKSDATSYGLTAPVGVSFAWGNAPVKGMSLGGFVSLIDLGAIASYRLGNSSGTSAGDTVKASNIPQVQLKNIVSPGIFFSVGLPKIPVSVNFGYQLAPTLRSITVVNSANTVQNPNTSGLANQYADKLYSRWSISLVVDIPIINLYTENK